MAVAQVIPIKDIFEEFMEKLHEAVDKWGEKFRDFFEREQLPSITEISERFHKTRPEFFGQCIEGILSSLASDFSRQEYAHCP